MTRGISFQGIGSHETTYKVATATKAIATASGNSAIEGKAITLTGKEEVGFGSDGNAFHGVLVKYEDDGYASVQDEGYFEDLPAVSGSVPTYGTRTLVVDGAGAVKSSGTAYTRGEVISSDDSASVNTITVLIG